MANVIVSVNEDFLIHHMFDLWGRKDGISNKWKWQCEWPQKRTLRWERVSWSSSIMILDEDSELLYWKEV